VDADPGAIGGSGSQEFMVLADTGEDTILFCDAVRLCRQPGTSRFPACRVCPGPGTAAHGSRPGRGLIGAEPLAKFLNLPIWKITKTLLYNADGQTVAVMVRGIAMSTSESGEPIGMQEPQAGHAGRRSRR